MSEQEQSQGEIFRVKPGEKLARERNRLGISLQDASRRLRLTTTILGKIERGELDGIPGAYLRGYVANYARLLEMDPEPFLQALEQLEPEPLRTVLPVDRAGQRMDRFVRFATYGLVTTLIVPPLVYFFVQGGASLLDGELPARTQAVVAAPAGPKSSEPDDQIPDPATSGAPAGRASTDSSHLSASALLLPTMRRPQESVENAAVESAAEDAVGEFDPRSVLELTLEDDCWVEIEAADGQRLEFDLLRAGQQHRYVGMAPFRLLLGRANAVHLALNGEPLELDDLARSGVTQFEVGSQAPVPALEDG